MTLAVLALSAACVALAVALALVVRRRRGPALEDLIGADVVVQIDQGTTTQGVLEGVSCGCLHLSRARHLGDGVSIALSGEVLVPRERVWRVERPRPADLSGAIE